MAPMAKINFLLIDGLNLVRRVFEANHRDDTDMTGCVEGCERSLARALNTHRPTHAAVVLDSYETTWRHLLYPEYKGNRKPTPEALIKNLDLFKNAFKKLGVPSITVAGYEADDVVSTLASGVASKAGDAIILSTDKGFLCLLSDQIRVYHHFEQRFVAAADVQRKYSLRNDQLIDFWALSGDPGNNIKGVPGVGKKTALLLMEAFDSLNHILSQARSMEAGDSAGTGELKEIEALMKPLAKVLKHEADALKCRLLLTPKLDVQVGTNLKDFRFSPAN